MSFSVSIKNRTFIHFLPEVEIFFRYGVTYNLSKCIEFCFGKISPDIKISRYENGSFYPIGESLNNF